MRIVLAALLILALLATPALAEQKYNPDSGERETVPISGWQELALVISLIIILVILIANRKRIERFEKLIAEKERQNRKR